MDHPTLVKDAMTTELITLSPLTHVFDGIAHLLRYNISGAPVVDKDRNYLGVFSEKCCMAVLTATAHATDVPGHTRSAPVHAEDFMVTQLLTLTVDMDVFDAIGYLIDNQISGAPVIDENYNFLGVFSEKTSMSVLMACAYDQLPTSAVGAFMNPDMGRTILEETDLMTVAHIFLTTPYRRLAVIHHGKLLGQICRRDVLRAQHHISSLLRDRERALLEHKSATLIGDWPDVVGHHKSLSFATAAFMDTTARTITEDTDLLSVAQIFQNTPYRRLPVLRRSKLVGQISRRDVLRATHDQMEVVPQQKELQPSLFLSAVVERHESPIDY